MQNPAVTRVWDTALGQLQLQVTRPNYDTWLKDTVGLTADNGSFVVGTPSDFVSEWLRAKMGPVITKTVTGILGRPVDIRFQVLSLGDAGNGREESPTRSTETTPPAIQGASASTPSPNDRFTFDRFVVSDCNRLAAAAALAASEQPGNGYNPLFIYGAPGLGKTHLLQSISHRSQSAGRHVLYVTCEQFTNEFVTALTQGRQEEFRQKYRSPRLLLVDDIQFLAGKERTQEEFFHTFNDLYGTGCQIVLTCDRPPSTVAGLERRLSSRFQAGLIADIQPPDHETRLAIISARALEQRIKLSLEVAQLLADRAQDNIRELEGSLNRVVAYARLTRAPISIKLATLALQALAAASTAVPPTPEAIIAAVARHFNLPPDALSAATRAKAVSEARHIAMYLLREQAQLPLKRIGYLLGNRDHSTVIHGCRKISTYIKTPKGRRQMTEIQAQLQG